MKVIVIGGGASGMVAAIKAADYGHEVTLLEHADRLGKKILSTGNGRCNITNEILTHEPWNSYSCSDKELVKKLFERFGFYETKDFFNEIGILLRSRNGLCYPYSDQATSVLNALTMAVKERNIRIVFSANTESIKPGKSFRIKTDKGEFVCDRLIIATGSKAQPKTGSDGSGYEIAKALGHSVNKVTPGLVQLKCRENFFKAVAGTRMKARLSLMDGGESVFSESGELQFTAYGISGIVAMNLSNRLPYCHGTIKVKIDLMEDYSKTEIWNEIQRRTDSLGRRKASELLNGIIPRKLSDSILKLAGISGDSLCSDITKNKISSLINNIKELTVEITGTNGFDEAQICLGGVSLDELTDNLESKKVPGLYFCGEILDLHGDCGGYNLQLAWTTGAVAGMML